MTREALTLGVDPAFAGEGLVSAATGAAPGEERGRTAEREEGAGDLGPATSVQAGEEPAFHPTEELRADGQRVAGVDELRTRAKDPGGREQHAVQHGAGSNDGIETARRTGDGQHPTRAGNPVGRRDSEEGGPPTPSAAAKRKRRPCRVFDEDGAEVFITKMCPRCRKVKPLKGFGLRRMPGWRIRNQPQCGPCRSRGSASR